MIIGVPSETYGGERRVALVPSIAADLIKKNHSVLIESGAGVSAGCTDAQFEQVGAKIVKNRKAVFDEADAILQVRCVGANVEDGAGDVKLLRKGQVLIGHCEPLVSFDQNQAVADTGATMLAVEMIPRTTRAQPMDALSSQANLAGYKCAIFAADVLPSVFPMMMTAAGTLRPAKVFVIGAGVAGLQAIATAKRLGAVVSAIDVRPEVKEQVESVGAKFVMPEDMAAGEGGYAKEQTEEQKRRQQELMASVVAESNVVISTAAIPGRKAPVLVSEAMVKSMAPGSVIVDMAAERGGNCELTEPGKSVVKHGVTIIGTENIPSTVPGDASRMYARNVTALLLHMTDKEGKPAIDTADEIVAGALICHEGKVVNKMVLQRMGQDEKPGTDQVVKQTPKKNTDRAPASRTKKKKKTKSSRTSKSRSKKK